MKPCTWISCFQESILNMGLCCYVLIIIIVFLFSSPIMFTFLTLLGNADFMQTSLAVQCASLEGEDGSLTEWDILYFSGSIL